MSSPSTATVAEHAPTVLVVLVVRDAVGWLRETLAALADQTYPRLAVMAVDRASTDGSGALLSQALSEGRVITLPRDTGTAGALRAVLELPVAREADYVLLVHDDVAIDPDGVAGLVEAAVGIPGIDRVGLVGAKVVDWDDPRELADVGRSADRFGHPYSPLQPGEIDQGQFDRVLEVLCVSSCAMLISRDAWQRVGEFDERLPDGHQDLDLCWRVRLAGFRVLMTPLARVRRRAAAPVEAGPGPERRNARSMEDRAAITAVLKNYSLLSLLWILPLSLALGAVRVIYLLLGRRFEEAYDLAAAWGWNVAHLPGTLARRRRVQKARRVKDRSLRRFMESAGLRLPRWFQTAERIWEEQRGIEADEEQPAAQRLRKRTASFVGEHPVIVGSFLGLVVGGIAVQGLLGGGALAGGVLPSFPAHASGFFAELDSAFRTTPLGGSLAASPALAAMGGLSTLLLGSTSFAQKVMLVGAPVLGAILMYRAAVRLTGRPAASIVAAAAYSASAIVMWSFSQGRLDLLLALAVLPAAVERLEVAFGGGEPAESGWRFIVGVGVTFAVLVAFLPGAALAVAVVVLVELVTARARVRGLRLTLGSAGVAVLLLLPFVPTLLAGGGLAFNSRIGTTDVTRLGRLAFGTGPGTWQPAAFLPIAALISFALVGPAVRAPAIRAALMAVAGLALSWLSASGYLPAALSNPLAYGALAAVGEALLIAFGLASVLTGLGRESFGLRQVGTFLLTVVLVGGIALQAIVAMIGSWDVGGVEKIPAAWAVVQSGAKGDYRVLWVGADDGHPFPAPGGDPEGVVDAGDATLRYGLTDRGGVTALDTGRPLTGGGRTALQDAIGEVLSGTSSHGGSLLAPFGVRFVVAGQGELPAASTSRLNAQVDLDLVSASGLVIYRNSAVIPPAAVLKTSAAQTKQVLTGTASATAALGPVPSTPMTPVQGGWNGPSRAGLVALSTEYSGSWEIQGSSSAPRSSFGWATAFPAAKRDASVRFGMQWPRTVEMLLLAVAWAAALWITRKPVRR